ncbi:hypothetical protein DESC_290167 [Desulfosarcina cetonica]|uniref:hypothetical protein n=1 Tax=Desulfosarcina cetonica TaxID=90730 RepID=UPI0006D24B88|nr:hypothetical protein [Desulfosarcina cetonica]VTR65097.1 hypothetical protein DESC_290167 [Desulfosarcina cetonica]
MINFVDAEKQKEYRLEPDSLFIAKDVEKMTGIKANRIHYFSDAGILIPARKAQKGEGILTYSFYDCVNVLEIFLINKLNAFFIPKRSIKEFFESIRDIRNSLNPFKISDHKESAFLIFSYDENGNLVSEFAENNSVKKAVSIVVDLKQLVSDLFKKVESLP